MCHISCLSCSGLLLAIKFVAATSFLFPANKNTAIFPPESLWTPHFNGKYWKYCFSVSVPQVTPCRIFRAPGAVLSHWHVVTWILFLSGLCSSVLGLFTNFFPVLEEAGAMWKLSSTRCCNVTCFCPHGFHCNNCSFHQCRYQILLSNIGIANLK